RHDFGADLLPPRAPRRSQPLHDLRVPDRRHAAAGPGSLRVRLSAAGLPAEPGAVRRPGVDPDRRGLARLPVADASQGAGGRRRDDLHRNRRRHGGPAMTDTLRLERERMIIGGEEVDAAGGETFTTLNPASGAGLAEVPSAGATDVGRAVDAAHTAFEEGPWPRMHARERGKVLLRMAEAIRARVDEIARLQTTDNGKAIAESRGEIAYAADVFEYYAGAANKVFGKTIPVAADGLDLTLREPLGVTAAIIPWNGPFAISSYKVAPALATGNTVVLKPPSLAPLSPLALGRIGLEVGLPPGVLNVVTGPGGTTGNA